LAEILAIEEERFAGCPGQGVGETVTKVETSSMAAFAVVGVALASQESLLFGDRLDQDAGLSRLR
jgi:hypothetical protein